MNIVGKRSSQILFTEENKSPTPNLLKAKKPIIVISQQTIKKKLVQMLPKTSSPKSPKKKL